MRGQHYRRRLQRRVRRHLRFRFDGCRGQFEHQPRHLAGGERLERTRDPRHRDRQFRLRRGAHRQLHRHHRRARRAPPRAARARRELRCRCLRVHQLYHRHHHGHLDTGQRPGRYLRQRHPTPWHQLRGDRDRHHDLQRQLYHLGPVDRLVRRHGRPDLRRDEAVILRVPKSAGHHRDGGGSDDAGLRTRTGRRHLRHDHRQRGRRGRCVGHGHQGDLGDDGVRRDLHDLRPDSRYVHRRGEPKPAG